jgi:DNA polymerase-3 subunit epsilon
METITPQTPATPDAFALFYDTETTGLPLWKEPSDHVDQPHIVQLAAKLVNLATREVLKSMDVIIRPDGWVIPDDVIAVHGITNERAAAEGIPEAEAIDQLLAMWGDVELIGHNESFDRRIVRIATKRHIDPRDPDLAIPVSDEWKAAKSYCTCYKARAHTKLDKNKLPKLTEAYQHFFGKPMEGAHSAGGDVDGCIAVYFAIQDAEALILQAA